MRGYRDRDGERDQRDGKRQRDTDKGRAGRRGPESNTRRWRRTSRKGFKERKTWARRGYCGERVGDGGDGDRGGGGGGGRAPTKRSLLKASVLSPVKPQLS